jgi:hypothetical protein
VGGENDRVKRLAVVVVALLLGAAACDARPADDAAPAEPVGGFEPVDELAEADRPCVVDPSIVLHGSGVLCDIEGVGGHVTVRRYDRPSEQRRAMADLDAAACSVLPVAVSGPGWALFTTDESAVRRLAADVGGEPHGLC